MPSVKVSENKIWVGETPISLISGEVHYWRLDPHHWRAALLRVRDMGLNIVATYVCWDYHEIAPGQYDFRGETEPRRNLLAFLDLLTEMGFWIILRPGPYIYSEWRNNGVPDHAAQCHRLDPEFLRQAEHYMAAVVEVTRPYLATQGGNIILWQSDNEIDPWPHIYTEELGIGQKVGAFHDYLRERYQEVAALNQAWGTSYASFENARAVSELFVNDPLLLGRYNDFRAFLHWYVNRVAAWGVDVYRRLQIDVPIMLNAYSGVGTQVWAEMEQIADIVGPDIYPSREFLYRTGEHRHIFEAMRYACTFSRLPYIPEYEAGIWHDWLEDVGTLTPNHYRLICFSALQSGAVGWNWYMLVNRDNWYQSPINEWGNTRPALFNVFQQITRVFAELDPTTLQRETHVAVTFDPLQRSTERPGQDLLTSFYNADLDYDFFDLTQGSTDKNVLFYAGGAWLSEKGQRRLVEYIEQGGHLICAGHYPRLDEHMHPLNLLNIPAPIGMVSGSPTRMNLTIFDSESVESPWAYMYENVPGEAITVERRMVRNQPSEELLFQFDRQTGARYTAGYTVERGKGRLTVLGLQPTAELLLVLHRRLNLPIPSRSRTPGVTSALFHRGVERYLIATNPGTEDKVAEIELASAGQWQVRDMLTGRTTQVTGRTLHLTLPRKDGTILHLTST